MRLTQLLSVLPNYRASHDDISALEINAITLDSRAVEKGSLFIAVAGSACDGRDYIASAISLGAAAVMYQDDDAFELGDIDNKQNVVCIGIDNLAQHIGSIGAEFYQHPSQAIQLVGVTGTNGKTSISFIVAQLLKLLAQPCVVAGTLGNGLLGELTQSANTTPDALSLQSLLAQFKSQDVKYGALEASSHGIVQGRLNALQFACLVFSNLSHDHLDFHGNYQAYGQAKLSLLTDWSATSLVVDGDDKFIQAQLETLKQTEKDLTLVAQCAPASSADKWQKYWHINTICALNNASKVELSCYQGATDVQHYSFELPVLGRFNVKNILLAAAALETMGFAFADMLGLLEQIELPAGRMQLVNPLDDNQPVVVVDYAHTPDALEQVLLALKAHVQQRLICVFGCGGNRDALKRQEMGQIAEMHADRVIITNDNPRFESAKDIADDIKSQMFGLPETELDRATAIALAIDSANAGDLIVIAGKGHEQYQEIDGQKLAFDDVGVAKACLAKKRGGL